MQTTEKLIEEIAEKYHEDVWLLSNNKPKGFQYLDERDKEGYRAKAREIIALFQPMLDEIRELAVEIKDGMGMMDCVDENERIWRDNDCYSPDDAADDASKILTLIPTKPDEPVDDLAERIDRIMYLAQDAKRVTQDFTKDERLEFVNQTLKKIYVLAIITQPLKDPEPDCVEGVIAEILDKWLVENATYKTGKLPDTPQEIAIKTMEIFKNEL